MDDSQNALSDAYDSVRAAAVGAMAAEESIADAAAGAYEALMAAETATESAAGAEDAASDVLAMLATALGLLDTEGEAAAHRRPAGERRDAILRLADELESKGDVTLVSHRTVVDALNAYLDKSHRPDRN